MAESTEGKPPTLTFVSPSLSASSAEGIDVFSPGETPLAGREASLDDDPAMLGWTSWRNSLNSTSRKKLKGLNTVLSSAVTPQPPPSTTSSDASTPRLGIIDANSRPGTTAKPLSLISFLAKEISWGKFRREKYQDQGELVQNIMKTPLKLEMFMFLGFLSCLDAFLHNFTYLPLRGLRSIILAPIRLLRGKELRRVHVYDVLRCLVILGSYYFLSEVQLSRVYHYIRGEAIIKLYVLFNILEIFDKLCCSIGQDIMDTLYRTIRDHPQSFSFALALHIVFAVTYVLVHSAVLYVQLVSLNVAINSRSSALLTLLISNNFVELKASVFKRFEAENLFQIACADVVERFQLLLFLSLILFQDVDSWDALNNFGTTAVAVFLCEVGMDWVKHAFVLKFNRISADMYTKFHAVLCHDLVLSRKQIKLSLDPTHAISRRLGLASIPLTCVVMRFVTIRFETQLPFSWGYLDTCLFLIVLFLLKVWISMLLLGYSGARRLSFEQMSPVFGNEAYTEPKSPEMPMNIKLDDVTRYGMFKGRIPQ